jgi:hypothetical protein
MKRTGLKQATSIFGIAVLAVLLFACPAGLQDREQYGKAMVSISVMDRTARTVFPQVSIEDIAFYILCGGNNGATETQLIEFTTKDTTILIDQGIWNFTLNAYNQNGELILQGKIKNQQIDLPGNNQVSFFLSSLDSGMGAIHITIKFPESTDITRVIVTGVDGIEEFTHDTGDFIYTKDGIKVGDYFTSFSFYNGSELRVVVSELVLVRSNLTSSKTITLLAEDLKPSAVVTIDINLYMNEWDLMTQTAQAFVNIDKIFIVNGTYVEYNWYLDGVFVGSSPIYTFNKQEAGVFELVVVVTNGSESRSGRCRITVVDTSLINLPLTSVAYITPYLAAHPEGGNADNPVNLVLKFDLGLMTQADSGWRQLLEAIEAVGKFVTLDLSDCTMDGTVFNPDNTVTTGKNWIVSIDLPEAARSIASGTTSDPTFKYFTSIRHVNIGNGIGEIGEAAFYGNKISSITIGNNVTSIGNFSFQNNLLTSLIIPEGVTYIGMNAFNTNRLTSVVISGTVDTIERAAFAINPLVSVSFWGWETKPGIYSFGYVSVESLAIAYSEFGAGTYINDGDNNWSGPWPLDSFTVIFNSKGGNSINPITGLRHGETITRPVDPKNDGYGLFDNWYSDSKYTTLFNFCDPVTANIVIHAKWNASYNIGDIGPGGGQIFYRNEIGFKQFTGSIVSDTSNIIAHYLEAAPVDISGRDWATDNYNNTAIIGTERAIGMGKKNTALILNIDKAAPAAKACVDYSNNGLHDWFLPSLDELVQLYINRTTIGNFEARGYWSSSQGGPEFALFQNFMDGSQHGNGASKNGTWCMVRAIRAF